MTATFLRQILSLSVLLLALCPSMQARKAAPAPSTAITVVSDTTDDPSDSAADTTFYVQPSVRSVQIVNPDLTSRSFWRTMFSKDGPGALFKDLFAGGAGFFMIVTMLIVLFILFLPLLLVLLVVFLLLRDHKRKRAAAATPRAPQDPAPAAHNRIRERKDNAVKHIVIGLGLTIGCYLLDWHFCLLVGIIILCIGIGEFLNVKRAERHKNDNENNS